MILITVLLALTVACLVYLSIDLVIDEFKRDKANRKELEDS